MIWISLGLLLGVIGILVWWSRGKERQAPVTSASGAPSYVLNPSLLSAAELSFYGVLRQAVPSHCLILAKVRVADLLQPAPGLRKSEWQRAFNRISAKHLDFVLCEAISTHILMAVELDDASHRAAARQTRDNFLDQALAGAGLRLLRVPAQAGYSVSSIRQALQHAGLSFPTMVSEPADDWKYQPRF